MVIEIEAHTATLKLNLVPMIIIIMMAMMTFTVCQPNTLLSISLSISKSPLRWYSYHFPTLKVTKVRHRETCPRSAPINVATHIWYRREQVGTALFWPPAQIGNVST